MARWWGAQCVMCGKTKGYCERTTYVGAPEEGIPVHPQCLDSFFRKFDGRMYRVPDNYVDRSETYGREFCEFGLSIRDRRRASHDAENKPALQALAKMAEVLFYLEYNLTITDKLWKQLRANDPRPQVDAITSDGVRLDIKHADFGDHYLVWPINKGIEELKRRQIDVLAMVKAGRMGDGVWGFCKGWITKADFLAKHQIADGDYIGKGLKLGTPFVHQDILSDPATLLDYRVKV